VDLRERSGGGVGVDLLEVVVADVFCDDALHDIERRWRDAILEL
jgi:hypothetical protein